MVKISDGAGFGRRAEAGNLSQVRAEMDQCSIADVRASVPRKITWRLIPFLFLLYVIGCGA